MKKTLIALAAVASLATSGAAFAQATISGGVGFASIKNLDGTSQGLLNTGAWLDVAASEDLGGGMKVSGFMELNMDGARGDASYKGDRNMVFSTSSFSLALANTRSGGSQAAALIAPVNLWDGYWGAGGVISRAAIDAVVLSVPMAGGLTVQGKYVEGGSNTYSAATAAALATYAGAPTALNKAALATAAGADAKVFGDGTNLPGSVSLVAAAIYAAGPLKISAGVTQTTFSDNSKLLMAAGGVTDPRTTSTDASVIYDAGVAKFGLGYDSARRGKANGTDDAAMLAGVTVPMGKASFGVNYGKRGNGSFNQFGAQYDLSKRTNVNLSFGNADTGAANGQTNEYSLSLNHYF